MFSTPIIYPVILAAVVIISLVAYAIENIKFKRIHKQLENIEGLLTCINSIQFDLAGQITGELPKGPKT